MFAKKVAKSMFVRGRRCGGGWMGGGDGRRIGIIEAKLNVNTKAQKTQDF